MKLNSALRSSVVLFLGAGASAPLGKMLMGTFIDHLSKLQYPGLTHIFQKIVKQKPDLEFLLEELGDLESKGYLDGDAGPAKQTKIFKETAQSATSIRIQIEREVFRHYSSFDGSTALLITPHFQPLFESLFKFLKPGEPLIIFTTNYDPAVEEFVSRSGGEYSLFDGLLYNPAYREEVWSLESFEQWKPSSGRQKDIVLIKLHGSTNWFERRDRIVRGPEIYAQGGHISNVLIYPAQRKVASDDPFFTAYYLFQQILRSAKCVLALGYSFRDLDALTRLREAALDNDQLRVGLVDPLAKNIEGNLVQHRIPVEAITGTYNPANDKYPSSPTEPLLGLIERFLGQNIPK
jgi:hypothetical protein